jgi:Arc/MetJ-type ribon-helix-helix transcriptional regulator
MKYENLSEKISVNVNVSTLASVDFLVEHGFYANRSDAVNQALRELIAREQTTIDRLIVQDTKDNSSRTEWFLGELTLTPEKLAAWSRHAGKEKLCGYGLLVIDEACDEELLFATVKAISVQGSVRGTANVKEHYGVK